MTNLTETATAVADHLNNVTDYVSSNWWDAATEVAGDYYSDELTELADPAYRSDVLVLTDGDQVVEVRLNEGAQRWELA